MFNKKKKYFKQKVSGIRKMIWDSEFKREKTLMVRKKFARYLMMFARSFL